MEPAHTVGLLSFLEPPEAGAPWGQGGSLCPRINDASTDWGPPCPHPLTPRCHSACWPIPIPRLGPWPRGLPRLSTAEPCVAPLPPKPRKEVLPRGGGQWEPCDQGLWGRPARQERGQKAWRLEEDTCACSFGCVHV